MIFIDQSSISRNDMSFEIFRDVIIKAARLIPRRLPPDLQIYCDIFADITQSPLAHRHLL